MLRWLRILVTALAVVMGLGIMAIVALLWLRLCTPVLPDLPEAGRTLLVLALVVAALLLAAAPWFLRVRRSLGTVREEKMLADARADMAAHLHDSVLQTLALIQKNAHDATTVARLARSQEREREDDAGGDRHRAAYERELVAADERVRQAVAMGQ